MDLLLLAHLVADGNQDAKASSAPVWATWIPAVITLLGSLVVAWWSGRKVDKQTEISKQGAPPELLRYKEWLEASEKYKGLVNFENVDALSIASEEYREIEASRKLAFEIAIWERKVLAVCPNIQAQKRMVQIPASKINEISNPDISGEIALDIDSYFRPVVSETLWLIVPFIYFSPLIFISGFSAPSIIFSLFAIALVLPAFYSIIPNHNNGTLEANFYTRKMRVGFLEEKYKQQGEIYNSSSLKIYDYWEKWCMVEGLRYSTIFDEWADYVHCPWADKGWFKRKWHKVWCYFCPGHYVRRSLKGKTKVLWGSYKDDKLNGNLKTKIKPKKLSPVRGEDNGDRDIVKIESESKS